MDREAMPAEKIEQKMADVTQTSVIPPDDAPSIKTEHPSQRQEAEASGRRPAPADADPDDDCEPFDLDSYQPAPEEVISKLLAQAEFYFSDSNVLKDKFLLKNIQENKGGFVKVKLLSSFRRMQAASKDWRDLAYALRRSEKLELNATGSQVRRKDPLPQWDDSVHDRTVVATNLQIPEVSVNAVKSIFDKCGAVTLVRVLQPGKNLPEDLQKFSSKHPELSTKVCAVIEFAKVEEAQKAVDEFGGKQCDLRGMQVRPLRGGAEPIEATISGVTKQGDFAKAGRALARGKENVAGKTVLTVDSSPSSSPSTRRKKASRSGGVPIPDKRKLDAFGGRASPCRSSGGDRRSPRPSSYASSGDEIALERFDNRTAPKPIPGRMQKHRGTPQGSPDTRRRGADESPLSCSPASLGTSPWVRRRAMMEQADPSSSPGRNLITVIRQPRGPDGSKGFSGLRSFS